jgi:hypothetical protein
MWPECRRGRTHISKGVAEWVLGGRSATGVEVDLEIEEEGRYPITRCMLEEYHELD